MKTIKLTVLVEIGTDEEEIAYQVLSDWIKLQNLDEEKIDGVSVKVLQPYKFPA